MLLTLIASIASMILPICVAGVMAVAKQACNQVPILEFVSMQLGHGQVVLLARCQMIVCKLSLFFKLVVSVLCDVFCFFKFSFSPHATFCFLSFSLV